MNESQLHSLRRDPSPAFASRLRVSLRALDTETVSIPTRWPLMKIAASVAIVALIAGVFSVPSVRASARSFLALFRVVNFVAVPVDRARLDTLLKKPLDLPGLIGEHVEILQDPGAPTLVASPAQAGELAGFAARTPGEIPVAMTRTEIGVSGERAARVTADTSRLRQVMDALGITDLDVPEGLDGQTATVRVPPIISMTYRQGPRVTRFLQTRSPQVTLPDGVDIAALGEIGLRLIGLPTTEAHDFARAIDWRTTLLVPVPSTVSSFKKVDINGHSGILIERQASKAVLWSADGLMFAIDSTQQMSDVMTMANSVK